MKQIKFLAVIAMCITGMTIPGRDNVGAHYLIFFISVAVYIGCEVLSKDESEK